MNFLRKIFPSYNERQLKKYRQEVGIINQYYNEYLDSDTAAEDKSEEFRKRIESGEELNSIMPEAFALVKYVMKKLSDEKYSYSQYGIHFIWDMVPYDVQLIGAMALHEGKITEMATGEGKTLAAVMPLYLNALTDRGAYLITVNDYLARRDKAWMSPVYENLGVSVGLIQSGMKPSQRQDEYSRDIVYITNNEFGFDFLRDNLTYNKRDKVHRDEFYFGIIDEVDSVLIDEARTPLIISGLPMDEHDREKTQRIYNELNSPVRSFVRRQEDVAKELFKKAKEQLESDNWEEGIYNLLKVKRAVPKHPPLLNLLQEADIVKGMEDMENNLRRDKNLHKVDEGLLFSIDEQRNSVHITDEGETEFSKIKGEKDFFILPQLSVELKEIDDNDSLSEEEKFKKKDEINNIYASKSEKIHSVHQLLKAYTLFTKDVDYIIKESKIVIVDEHTGRLMPGRRFSEGMHSAIEAKENVDIEEETKTLATITLQNLFRMFVKLSGMTGTAETEAQEFKHIYDLDVIVIPTNRPVIRQDRNDVVFVRKSDKIKYIADRIVNVHNAGIPLLIGTASVASSEYLDRKLKPRKDASGRSLNYNILNAKNNEGEAEIVAEAGDQGSVTVATNMAGRGTDIKLGKTIKMLPERSAMIQALRMREADRKPVIICRNDTSLQYIDYLREHDNYLSDKKVYFSNEESDDKILIVSSGYEGSRERIILPDTEDLKERNVCVEFDSEGNCLEYVPAGLYVLGTEKHESRRIDRQLRGRSGRQGDPGTSQFTVSLEDDLMRVFGADRMSSLIDRMEAMSGDQTAVSHRLLTSSIENAQKRIENINFERRKFLLEYDDVINKQREVVYELRDFFLFRALPIEYVNKDLFYKLTDKLSADLKKYYNDDNNVEMRKMRNYINHTFQVNISEKEFYDTVKNNALQQELEKRIKQRMDRENREILDYIYEYIPPMAEEYILSVIRPGSFKEEWPYDIINDYLLAHFSIKTEEPDEDISISEFAESVREKIERRIKERCEIPRDFADKLNFVMTQTFIRAIDAQWVEQLYELEAIREGITLRGYAKKDPLVEFKKEAYLLFSDLIDSIYAEFIKKFFESKILSDIEDIGNKQFEEKRPVIFTGSGEEDSRKQEPFERKNKKIGRNDPCWCGSGKKYKHCHGRNK